MERTVHYQEDIIRVDDLPETIRIHIGRDVPDPEALNTTRVASKTWRSSVYRKQWKHSKRNCYQLHCALQEHEEAAKQLIHPSTISEKRKNTDSMCVPPAVRAPSHDAPQKRLTPPFHQVILRDIDRALIKAQRSYPSLPEQKTPAEQSYACCNKKRCICNVDIHWIATVHRLKSFP